MTRGRKATHRSAASAVIGSVLALLLAAFVAAPAFAIGGGSRPAAPAAPAAKKCGAGWYWSKRRGACAKICPRGKSYACRRKKCGCYNRRRGELSDDELYLEAVSLIESGHYRAALDLLRSIEKRDVPKVLNYIGYSTRKLGDVDAGIKYYNKALALDPNYNVAREYLGEGYLQKGDLAKAKRQLAEIESRCGKDCHAYEELAAAIVKFEARAETPAQ